MPSTQEPSPLVEFAGVTKSFGATVALKDVTLKGLAGTVHAVTGENGAGKSTLMNLLAGIHVPNEGEIKMRGRKAAFGTAVGAREAGVSTIFQELTLLPNLTVAENMFLGREPRSRVGLIDRPAMRRLARAALDRLGSHIDVDSYCGELTVGEQQLVEIARGMSADAEVFILDEPTAALNVPEVEKLAELIQSMKESGKLIFYISHRLDEIFRFCDTVSVLKDGRHVATKPVSELDHDSLVSLMVGRTIDQLFPERPKHKAGSAVKLRVENLQAAPRFPPVSLDLKRGEILGLAGLEGQGQRSIIRGIAGLEAPVQGKVEKINTDSGASDLVPPDIVSVTTVGIGFIPEDRKTEGLYLPLSIFRNVALGQLRQQSIWRNARTDAADVESLIARMQVQAASSDQVVGALSGGNQQKVMIGRWLASKVDVLLVEEPTRGVDVGAKAEIYGLLRDFADAGGAILLTSSELTEVLGLCDRILVVREGDLVAEFEGSLASEESVMRAALTGRAQDSGEVAA